MKKTLSVILSVLMAFSVITSIPFSAYSAELEESGTVCDGITYTFNSETGALVLSGSGAVKSNYMFNGNGNIKSVTFEEGITDSGFRTFYNCSNIENVEFCSTLSRINQECFMGCTALTSLNLVSGVNSLDSYAFKDCPNIKSVYVSETVTLINSNAIDSTSLEEFVVNSSNKYYKAVDGNIYEVSYGSRASTLYLYAAGNKRTSYTLPSTVSDIHDSAFMFCGEDCALKEVNLAGNFKKVPSGAFKNASSIETINLSDKITVIENGAFHGCTSLKNISIPSALQELGNNAFYGCYKIKSIVLPDTVTNIGYAAFNDCGVTSVTISNPNCTIYDRDVTIPQGVKIYGYTKCAGEASTAQEYAEKYGNEYESIAQLTHTFGEVQKENEVLPTYESDGSYDNVVRCTICGQIASSEHIVVPKLNSFKEEVDSENVTFETGSETLTYQFTPKETAIYQFESTNHSSWADPNITVYLDGVKITESPLYGYRYGYRISYKLEAGKTYDLKITNNCEENASFTNTISKLDVKEIRYDYKGNTEFNEYSVGAYEVDSNGNRFFYYYFSEAQDGDVLTVVDSKGNEYPYTCKSGKYTYTNYLGETSEYYRDDIVFKDSQYNTHWTVGGENYITVNAFGLEYKLPVTVKKTSVTAVTYTAKETPFVIDGINDYGTESVLINNKTGKEYFYYETEILDEALYQDGNVLSVTYNNGETVDYTCKNGTWTDVNGNRLEGDIFVDVDQEETPLVLGTNKVKLIYGGAYCNIDFDVKKIEGVTKIEFVSDSQLTAPAYSSGVYIDGKFYYDIPSIIASDKSAKIVVTMENGTTNEYSFNSEFGGFEIDDYTFATGLFTNYQTQPWEAGTTNNAVLKLSGFEVNIPITILDSGIKNVELTGYINPVIDGNGKYAVTQNGVQYYDWESGAYPFTSDTKLSVTKTDGTKTDYTFDTKTRTFCDSNGEKCEFEFTLTDTQEQNPWKNGTNYLTFYCAGKSVNIPVKVINSKNAEKTPTASKISIAKAVVTGVQTKIYTGKNIAQSISVKVNGKVLKAGTDYTVSYKNNKNVGTASVIITGRGNYTGTLLKTFAIIPKSTTLKKVTKGKKQFKVTWKKQTTQTTGYQIQYSTNKNFKKANKIVNVGKNKTVSKTVKKLKKKKKYYVRIRTYKKVGNKTYYSKWSKSKSVKTK